MLLSPIGSCQDQIIDDLKPGSATSRVTTTALPLSFVLQVSAMLIRRLHSFARVSSLALRARARTPAAHRLPAPPPHSLPRPALAHSCWCSQYYMI